MEWLHKSKALGLNGVKNLNWKGMPKLKIFLERKGKNFGKEGRGKFLSKQYSRVDQTKPNKWKGLWKGLVEGGLEEGKALLRGPIGGNLWKGGRNLTKRGNNFQKIIKERKGIGRP